MRRSLFLATGFLLALTAPSSASYVLLPDVNSTPHLGISPPPPQTAPVAPPTPSTAAPLAPPPALTTTTTTTPDLTGAPQSQTGAPDITQVITPIDKVSAAGLPPGTTPTQVIQEPEATDPSQANSNLPYGLVITVTNQSVFGGQDVQTITSRLGLTRTQIPNSCVLAPRGIMQTTKGDYIITGRATPQALIKYDGVISNFVLNATALCVVNGQLPPGSGFLEKTGAYFNIGLQMITCPLPTRQYGQLNITYNGTENAQCVYQ